MDFVRLGPVNSTDYIPDKLIEGYNSLIWTERFQAFGEFELKTFEVDRIMKLLPEDTLVSHLETREVMQVETHSIDMVGEGADAVPELTVKGRSATIILEHRWVESRYGKKRRMRKAYSATGACSVLLYNAIDNDSGNDVTRGDDDPDTDNIDNDYPWTVKDVLPNVSVTESVTNEGETRKWVLEQGILYPQLEKIFIDSDLGIRCLRPVSPNPATVVTVKSILAERGEIVRTEREDVTALRFEVYDGIDRSNKVKFSLLQGHLDKPRYLFSNQVWKSVTEVMSGVVSIGDIYRPGDGGLTGWQRKTMGFDAGTPDIRDEPEKPKDLKANATKAEREQYAEDMNTWNTKHANWVIHRDKRIDEFVEEQTKKAENALKKNRKLRMFAGDSSDISPWKYKVDYDLGDSVMLYGDYDRTAKMVVSEYVRTEDANGDRGIPGLVAP
jgi:hypothetical protein